MRAFSQVVFVSALCQKGGLNTAGLIYTIDFLLVLDLSHSLKSNNLLPEHTDMLTSNMLVALADPHSCSLGGGLQTLTLVHTHRMSHLWIQEGLHGQWGWKFVYQLWLRLPEQTRFWAVGCRNTESTGVARMGHRLAVIGNESDGTQSPVLEQQGESQGGHSEEGV